MNCKKSNSKRPSKKTVVRMAYGEEKGKWFPLTLDGQCNMCGTEHGQYHPLFCPVHQCSVCGGQIRECLACGALGSEAKFWYLSGFDYRLFLEERLGNSEYVADRAKIFSKDAFVNFALYSPPDDEFSAK